MALIDLINAELERHGGREALLKHIQSNELYSFRSKEDLPFVDDEWRQKIRKRQAILNSRKRIFKCND